MTFELVEKPEVLEAWAAVAARYPGCASTDRLQAHHDRSGYDASCGRLLCWEHHKHEDPYAR